MGDPAQVISGGGPDAVTQLDLAEVRRAYCELANYKVVRRTFRGGTGRGRAKCMVFFASHGIYYPNTSAQAHDALWVRDRYEWVRSAPRWAAKTVFIRDVQKQWYLDGINQTVNSLGRLIEWLREETIGLDVTCVGSSAGGFAAVVCGCALKAERIFSFAGQFDLMDAWRRAPWENPVLVRHVDHAKSDGLISAVAAAGEGTSPVWYFYAAGNESDAHQVALVRHLPCVHAFAFQGTMHGVPCLPFNCTDLFRLSNQELNDLHAACQGRELSREAFSLMVSGRWKTARWKLGGRWTRTRESLAEPVRKAMRSLRSRV